MSSCHASVPLAKLTPETARAELESFLAARRSDPRPVADLEGFERDLFQRVLAVGRAEMAQELAKFDVDVAVVQIDGVAHRRVLRCEDTYWGVMGPIRVERSLYSTPRREGTACPMELRAGVVDGRWTPWAAQQATWVVSHLTPQEGEDLFRQLGGLTPSKSSLDRLPKALSERWEAHRVEWEEALRSTETVPEAAATVAVSLDGVLLPMKDGQRQRKRQAARDESRRIKGPAGYCEAGCATLSFYDSQGERLKTIRFARMPETKKATLKTMLTAELEHVLTQRPGLHLVKLSDAFRDNWDYLSGCLPSGTELVDFFHAAEHLRAALVAAYGEASTKGLAQFDKLRRLLLEEPGGADKVIRALRHLRAKHPHRQQLKAELTYFRRNRRRMAYAEAAARKLPIGSGVVEAACKTLVTQRMKRSGMRWGLEGGQAILTLRSCLQSDRFHHAWDLLAASYTAQVTTHENLITFPPRRSVNA